MNIARKILLGYCVVLIPLIAVAVYALSSLDQMIRINETIVKVNHPVIESTEKITQNLLGQEFYSRRLSILKDNESLELLQTRFSEFGRLLKDITSAGGSYASVRELSVAGSVFLALVSGSYHSMDTALALSGEERMLITRKRQEVMNIVKMVNAEVHQNLNLKYELSSAIGMRAYKALFVFGIASVLMSAGIASLFARSISSSVRHLKLSIQQISDNKFDDIRQLGSSDEFGEVSRSIAIMSRKIEFLENLYLATNPLTLLPGGVTIDDTIRTRLDASVPTALCMIDIDNFKVFNDRYGFARGNEVIQATAKIIANAVTEAGTSDDFIGHIGGDDFVVVTSTEKYEKICKEIIKSFDEKIPAFYDPSDRQKGTIVGISRQGQELVFPLMTVSIGVVTDQNGAIRDHLVLSRLAAELKELAKSLPGSVYVLEKRRYTSEAKV
jgi:diguanylate cyclase (GGDEF)-like protein